jgi:SAM-dependent methyltransferase
MGKRGEIDYLKNIGADGLRHATDKPFSDEGFARLLIDLGALVLLLPPPPARVLDVGCGTGWTSCFLAKRGYHVVGQDIAPDMIAEAENNVARYETGDRVSFVVADYEEMAFRSEFDAAVFFDSLHHSVDERAALRAVYTALRPGGVCLTSEPGEGHARSGHSVRAVRDFGVTERDMPARRIIRAARAEGFIDFRTFPHLSRWASRMYTRPPAPAAPPSSRRWVGVLLPSLLGFLKAGYRWGSVGRDGGGVVFMRKGDRPGAPSAAAAATHVRIRRCPQDQPGARVL